MENKKVDSFLKNFKSFNDEKKKEGMSQFIKSASREDIEYFMSNATVDELKIFYSANIKQSAKNIHEGVKTTAEAVKGAVANEVSSRIESVKSVDKNIQDEVSKKLSEDSKETSQKDWNEMMQQEHKGKVSNAVIKLANMGEKAINFKGEKISSIKERFGGILAKTAAIFNKNKRDEIVNRTAESSVDTKRVSDKQVSGIRTAASSVINKKEKLEGNYKEISEDVNEKSENIARHANSAIKRKEDEIKLGDASDIKGVKKFHDKAILKGAKIGQIISKGYGIFAKGASIFNKDLAKNITEKGENAGKRTVDAFEKVGNSAYSAYEFGKSTGEKITDTAGKVKETAETLGRNVAGVSMALGGLVVGGTITVGNKVVKLTEPGIKAAKETISNVKNSTIKAKNTAELSVMRGFGNILKSISEKINNTAQEINNRAQTKENNMKNSDSKQNDDMELA